MQSFWVFFCLFFLAAASDSPIIGTPYGPIEGVTIEGFERKIYAFRGIPYGRIHSRFRDASEPLGWQTLRDATKFGPRCLQRGSDGSPLGVEDCLSLNIFVPAVVLPTRGSSSLGLNNEGESGTATSTPTGDDTGGGGGGGEKGGGNNVVVMSGMKKLPVMVYIHGGVHGGGGGGFVSGGSDSYDGAELAAATNTIVVTFNFRLGVFGFFAHKEITRISRYHTSGNTGILDQIRALRWIQDNIGVFAGDASRVLVFGEGAGAFSVCILLVSPLARGLFSSAVLQSPACVPHNVTLKDRESIGEQTMARLNCTNLACLRSLEATDLLLRGTVRENDWIANAALPSIDGYVLPAAPLQLVKEQRHNKVPVILGTNGDEISLFLSRSAVQGADGTGGGGSGARYSRTRVLLDYLQFAYPSASQKAIDVALKKMLSAYTVARFGTRDAAATALGGDAFFTCGTRRMARALAQLPGSSALTGGSNSNSGNSNNNNNGDENSDTAKSKEGCTGKSCSGDGSKQPRKKIVQVRREKGFFDDIDDGMLPLDRIDRDRQALLSRKKQQQEEEEEVEADNEQDDVVVGAREPQERENKHFRRFSTFESNGNEEVVEEEEKEEDEHSSSPHNRALLASSSSSSSSSPFSFLLSSSSSSSSSFNNKSSGVIIDVGPPVWVYLFNKSLAWRSPLLNDLGVFHGIELAYLFGFNQARAIFGHGTIPTADDLRVQKDLRNCWASLARSGDPNHLHSIANNNINNNNDNGDDSSSSSSSSSSSTTFYTDGIEGIPGSGVVWHRVGTGFGAMVFGEIQPFITDDYSETIKDCECEFLLHPFSSSAETPGECISRIGGRRLFVSVVLIGLVALICVAVLLIGVFVIVQLLKMDSAFYSFRYGTGRGIVRMRKVEPAMEDQLLELDEEK